MLINLRILDHFMSDELNKDISGVGIEERYRITEAMIFSKVNKENREEFPYTDEDCNSLYSSIDLSYETKDFDTFIGLINQLNEIVSHQGFEYTKSFYNFHIFEHLVDSIEPEIHTLVHEASLACLTNIVATVQIPDGYVDKLVQKIYDLSHTDMDPIKYLMCLKEIAKKGSYYYASISEIFKFSNLVGLLSNTELNDEIKHTIISIICKCPKSLLTFTEHISLLSIIKNNECDQVCTLRLTAFILKISPNYAEQLDIEFLDNIFREFLQSGNERILMKCYSIYRVLISHSTKPTNFDHVINSALSLLGIDQPDVLSSALSCLTSFASLNMNAAMFLLDSNILTMLQAIIINADKLALKVNVVRCLGAILSNLPREKLFLVLSEELICLLIDYFIIDDDCLLLILYHAFNNILLEKDELNEQFLSVFQSMDGWSRNNELEQSNNTEIHNEAISFLNSYFEFQDEDMI